MVTSTQLCGSLHITCSLIITYGCPCPSQYIAQPPPWHKACAFWAPLHYPKLACFGKPCHGRRGFTLGSMCYVWCSTSNPKCHVTFSGTEMNVNWHLHFLLRCHLNATCLVMRVISICTVSIDVWFFSFHKSHCMSESKSCVSSDVRFVFFASFCMSDVKDLQKLCKKYTLVQVQETWDLKYPLILDVIRDRILVSSSRVLPL